MKRIINILVVLVMLAGIVLLGFGANMYYTGKKAEEQAMEEVQEVLEAGNARFEKFEEKERNGEGSNTDTDVTGLSNGYYSKELRDVFKANFGDSIGVLEIPKIDGYLPIVEGTDEDDLLKGVGHYTGTAFPMEEDQIVLSGHRDTVFKRMKELKVGDIMTMKMEYGSFDYEIVDTYIVKADDLTVIVPHDEETLTVTTCYPFSYIGKAPDRYIVDAKPVGR